MNIYLLIFSSLILMVSSYRTSKPRISAEKCVEYCRSDRSEYNVGGLDLGPPVTQKIVTSNCISVQGLIVGGIEAESAKEFPHMAALGWRNKDGTDEFACGGSLISDRFVLTAAHCSKKAGKLPSFVRLGDLNLSSLGDDADAVDYEIKNFTRHPQYKPRYMQNDIALIELVERVEFSKYIRPACLHQANEKVGTEVIATGWGKMLTSGDTSDVLRKVKLDVTNQNDCNIQLKDEIKAKKILPSQICAGNRNKDTCDGDSGGPIQVIKSDCQCTFSVVGITSYSASIKCGSGVPALYTRVSSYLDWIEGIVWPESTINKNNYYWF